MMALFLVAAIVHFKYRWRLQVQVQLNYVVRD